MIEQEIDNLFVKNKRFYLTKGRPHSMNGTSYIRVYKDGNHMVNKHDVCHASMMYGTPHPLDVVHTSLYVMHREHLDACNRFIDWIFSDASPWAKAAKGSKVHRDKDGVPLYVTIVTADDDTVPGTLFFNLIHMSRCTYEKCKMVALWAYLIDNYGFTPERALAYAYNHRLEGKEKGTCIEGDTGHIFLPPYTIIDIDRLESKDPKLRSTKSYTKGGVGGCSDMWDTEEDLPGYNNSDLCYTGEKHEVRESVFPLLKRRFATTKLSIDKLVTKHLEKIYADKK